MFTKIGTFTVGISDQDKALDLSVHKLGFEKMNDQPMSGTERWLELALPGTQTRSSACAAKVPVIQQA